MHFADCIHEMTGMFASPGRRQGPGCSRPRAACPRWCAPTKAGAPDRQPAGQRGEVHQQRRGLLRVRYARELATIEIQDTGPGLSADEISQIFEPSARGSSPAQAAPGAGLGLTMAKMLTDLMGGEHCAVPPARAPPSRVMAIPALSGGRRHARAVVGRPAAPRLPGPRRTVLGGGQRRNRPRTAGATAHPWALKLAHRRQRPRLPGPAGHRLPP